MILATQYPAQVFKYDLSVSFFEIGKLQTEARDSPEHSANAAGRGLIE